LPIISLHSDSTILTLLRSKYLRIMSISLLIFLSQTFSL